MKTLRKQIVLTLLALTTFGLEAQTVIWSENFDSQPEGTNNLNQTNAKWWTNAHDADDGETINNDNTNYWGVYNGEFKVNDIEGTWACGSGSSRGGDNDNFWYSEAINVSAYPSFTISMKGRAEGDMECGGNCNAADLLEGSYQLDGGPWVNFFAMCGATNGTITAGCIQVGNAHTLKIRIQAGTQASGESYYFDDIQVLATPDITGEASMSIATTTNLSISATGGSWSSSNSYVATVDQTGKVSALHTGTTTISYELPSGCNIEKTITVQACTVPTVTASNADRCGAGSLSLAATTSAGTLSWYATTTSTAVLGTGTSFNTGNISSTTDYYVSATHAGCTSARKLVKASIKSNPSITGASSICDTASIQLSASGTPATSNAWQSSNTAVASVNSQGLVKGISAGSTQISYSTAEGCSTSYTINVHALPSITGNLSLNENATTTLATNMQAATSNAWTSSNPNVATISNIGLVNTYLTGNTDITFTSINACSNTISLEVIPTTASISYTGLMCTDDTNAKYVNLTGTGSYTDGTFSATPAGLNINSTDGSIYLNSSFTGTYTVNYRYFSNGAYQTASTTVVVSAKPNFVNNTSSCVSLQALYNIDVTLSHGQLSSTYGSTSDIGANNWKVSNISSSQDVVLTATSNGCSNTLNITAPTCIACPNTQVPTSNGDQSFCSGSSIPNLSVSILAANQAYWYSAASGGNLLQANSTSFQATQAGDYYVEARDISGLCISERIKLSVKEIETPSITNITPGKICGSGTATLSAQASAGTVKWYSQAAGGTAIQTGNSYTTPFLTNSTAYYAEAQNQNCISTSRSSVDVNVFEAVRISSFKIENRNELSMAVSGGESPYSYKLNNEHGWLADSSLVLKLNSGNQILSIYDENNCSADTTFVIDDKPMLIPAAYFSPNNDGINDFWQIENIEFYPKTEVFIYNRFGKELKAFPASKFEAWDGTYLGKSVPSEDYWYVIQVRETGDRLHGHFTLKR